MENYNCPICGNESRQIMSLKEVDIFRCKSCTHAFSKNINLKIEEIYTKDYFTKEHKNFFLYPDTKLYSQILQYIKESKKENISILDIGCGTGNLLKFFKQNGFNNLTGIDLVDNSDDVINFIKSDILNYANNNKYDVIISTMNIEHILNLDGYVKKIKDFMKDDTLVIINTIDESSLIYLISKILYKLNIKFVANRLYEPHHVNHFSSASLKKLFTKFGFKQLKCISKNYPLKAIDVPNGKLQFIQKLGVFVIFAISYILNMGISQTQFFVEDKNL